MLLELHLTLALVLPRSWFALFHVATACASVFAFYLMVKTLTAQWCMGRCGGRTGRRLRSDVDRLLPLSQKLVWTGVIVLLLSLLSGLANYLVASTAAMQTANLSPQLMMQHSREALAPIFGSVSTLFGCLVVRIHVLWKLKLEQ